MIDDNFLYETGVYSGLSAKERTAFLAHSKAELDKRVGEILAGLLTSEQIETFENFMHQGEQGAQSAVAWVTKVVPDYQNIVLRTLGELKADIINHRSAIIS